MPRLVLLLVAAVVPLAADPPTADQARDLMLLKLKAALAAGPTSPAYAAFREARAAAVTAHGAVIAMAIDDAAIAAIEAERALLIAALAKELAETDGLRNALASELERRRKRALSVVDSPAFSAKTLPLAQTRIAELAAIWEQPATEALATFRQTLAKPLGRVAALGAMRKDYCDGTTRKADVDPQADELARLRAAADVVLDPKMAPVDRYDHAAVLATSRAVRAANARVTEISAEEREGVDLVNQYREMFGRPALAIDMALIQAARAHSTYMRSSKRFGHNLDGHPDGRTPVDRCAKFGFVGITSENILQDDTGPTPARAIELWKTSPPHHRAMVRGEVVAMGCAHDQGYWTQVFGRRIEPGQRK